MPFHAGHRDMFEYVNEHYGQYPALNICLRHPDKGIVDMFDLTNRIHLLPDGILFVDSYSRFVDKEIQYPGKTWVVGADTFNRIQRDDYRLSEYTILHQMKFLVFERDGHKIDDRLGLDYIVASLKPTSISSTEVRNGKS